MAPYSVIRDVCKQHPNWAISFVWSSADMKMILELLDKEFQRRVIGAVQPEDFDKPGLIENYIRRAAQTLEEDLAKQRLLANNVGSQVIVDPGFPPPPPEIAGP